MRTDTFDLHARAAGLDLDKFLQDRRGQDPPMSLADIAYELRTLHGLKVSEMTLSRWCRQRGIESSRPRAARKENAEVGVTQKAGSDSHAGPSDRTPSELGTDAAVVKPSSPTSAEIEGEARVPAPATPPESALERELRLSREASK